MESRFVPTLVVAAALLLASAGCGAVATSTTTAPQREIAVTDLATNLDVPWEIRFLPDGTMLVTERRGRLVRIHPETGATTEVGTIPVNAVGEGGLMGLAVDPGFPIDPFVYVAYTYAAGGSTLNRVSRFEISGAEPTEAAPPLGDTASTSSVQELALGVETILVDGIPGGTIHNGSRVAFGPDGFLWVTTGDAGRPELAQDLSSLAGKVLRMTKEGAPAPGNPFPSSLVYTYGHRNPQGLAFHPVSGEGYVTEHGPANNDEINRLVAGGNYGWPEVGGAPGNPLYQDAVMSWTPTIAPAGATFYQADLLPQFAGAFLFVTLKGSDLRVLRPKSSSTFSEVMSEEVLLNGELGRLRAIAVGPDGALYLATSNRDGRGSPRAGDDRIVRLGPGS